jgi:hypothetical protein
MVTEYFNGGGSTDGPSITDTNTTPTGSDNPFNTGTTDNVRDDSDGTYRFGYDFGGTQDDPNNSPGEQLEETLGVDLKHVAIVAAVAGTIASFAGVL